MTIRDKLDTWLAQLDANIAHVTEAKVRLTADRTKVQALRGRMIANTMTEVDAELLYQLINKDR